MKGNRPEKSSQLEKTSVRLPRMRALTKNIKTATVLAKMQTRIYPKKMREGPHTLLSILESTDMSRGLFIDNALVGYALFQKSSDKTIYLYDIAVLPHLQHKGLGTWLVHKVLSAARKRGLRIKMHVRTTSYPLFVNEERLRAAGYRLVSNKFLPDWYFGEFGIHEDAHKLVMEPIPAKSTKARTGTPR